MFDRVGHATRCAVKVAGGLILLAAAACTDMGPEPEIAAPPVAAAPPRLPTPVPRPALPPPPPPATAETFPGALPADVQPEPGVHRVRQGETVYTIAGRYGVDAYALVTANRLAPPFDLLEGQRLAIPGAAPATAVASSAGSPEPDRRQPTARPDEAAPVRDADDRSAALPRPAPPPAEPPQGEGGFVWPIEGRVISDFGAKGGGRYNDGINIAAQAGAPVRAAQSGVVAYAGNELRGFGNMLLIKHAGGWVTTYAHNQDLLVRRGDSVRRGQLIARAGATGGVDQPQLHFEIRKGKKAVDPLQRLPRPSATASGSRAAG